ncbi:hypothetical protein SDRG_16646 [Saprolegnia diclina VS20]|uniref:Uncharacterized protein n=1 Tax=Saprolegnia diclina (strain VS20) TaxID=1156394 RepID=T0R0K2_SAPDV|nr:hypothetical protein SDRG_16646 [Saprolegnia diclina VS20]EQC25488.1 hypothetical protein SDRG_16646 [Saprolegnia diclina VS20]|eukprot:XP_008621084.1 hypothetical protein SDRG_16646 [Saprolegnia diclina VS20]
MDYAVTCSSGVVSTGSGSRALTAVVVQGGILLVCLGASWLQMRGAKRAATEASLLVSGIAQAYIVTETSGSSQFTIDHVACVLMGLLPLRFRGADYTFDIKLWLVLRDELSSTSYLKVFSRPAFARQTVVVKPQVAPTVLDAEPRSMPRGYTIIRVLGLGYVSSSILGSVSYLSVSEVNLANDVYWAIFNTTGAHAFIANWLKERGYEIKGAKRFICHFE